MFKFFIVNIIKLMQFENTFLLFIKSKKHFLRLNTTLQMAWTIELKTPGMAKVTREYENPADAMFG